MLLESCLPEGFPFSQVLKQKHLQGNIIFDKGLIAFRQ